MSTLEQRLGHTFAEPSLLAEALAHRSWAFEGNNAAHYERLELLGDAVLGLLATEWLYHRYPSENEGQLAKRKGTLVSEPVLAEASRRLELGGEIRLGVGEERAGGRDRDGLLADVFEAVLGALYLDGGIEPARRLAKQLFDHEATTPTRLISGDAKTALQEYLQARGLGLPVYLVIETSGPDHRREFLVQCQVADQLMGLGEGASKKKAEQAAAQAALERLEGGARLS
jgi:ribonuclease-3